MSWLNPQNLLRVGVVLVFGPLGAVAVGAAAVNEAREARSLEDEARERQACFSRRSDEEKSECVRRLGGGTIAEERLIRGLDVYPQSESWTCGPHSALRLLLILGRGSIQAEVVASFVARAPKTLGGVGADVGPMPAELAAYSQLRHCRHGAPAAAGAFLRDSVGRQEPVVVLVGRGGLLLHYVVVVGHSQRGFVILDTGNSLSLIAESELLSTMDTYLGVHTVGV